LPAKPQIKLVRKPVASEKLSLMHRMEEISQHDDVIANVQRLREKKVHELAREIGVVMTIGEFTFDPATMEVTRATRRNAS
jgi:hypothetical protein